MFAIKEYMINFSVLVSIIYISGFLYKQFLVNSRERFIAWTLIFIAVFAGWSSMFFGIQLNESVIFDLRFIPVIIATMYSRNPLYILMVGAGIGLARLSFGITPAAMAGFYVLILVSLIGAILSLLSRRWRLKGKVALIVVMLNIANILITGLIGVIPFHQYMSVVVPSVIAVNIVMSFLLLWMVKDLSDEYINRMNLLNSSRKDPLTQLYNRRALMYYYDHFTTGRTKDFPLSIAFIDIDHFKRVNDQYGHLVGDIVLQKVSEVIAQNIRSDDVIARYGGEEFVILLPKCNREEVLQVVERIRKTVEDNPIVANGISIWVTLSAGIATSPGIKANQLLKKADDALLAAKRNGRNQIEYAV